MAMDGPPRMVAWQPGQVGNEAAKPNYLQCRGFGSSLSPSNRVLIFMYEHPAATDKTADQPLVDRQK